MIQISILCVVTGSDTYYIYLKVLMGGPNITNTRAHEQKDRWTKTVIGTREACDHRDQGNRPVIRQARGRQDHRTSHEQDRTRWPAAACFLLCKIVDSSRPATACAATCKLVRITTRL